MGEIGSNFVYKLRTYQFCTGYENKPFTCWWCNSPFEAKRQRMFCSEHCKFEYLRHFYWVEASNWARHRADNKCQECRHEGGVIDTAIAMKSDLEVHHIIPTNGMNRVQCVLNAPCLLIVLCQSCHNKTKKKLSNIINQLAQTQFRAN